MSGVRSKVIAAASVGLAVALGIAGCGAAKQLSAKQQVTSALSGFNAAKSAAFTITLDTTVADVAALSKADGSPMSAADQKDLAQVLDGQIVLDVQAPAGKTFGDVSKESTAAGTSQQDLTKLLNDPAALQAALKKEGAYAMSVQLAGGTLVDLRSLDGVIYLRADVKKILSLSGTNPSSLDQQLAALPPSLAPLAKAAKGEWVSVDLLKAAEAVKSSGLLKSLPMAASTPTTADPAKVQKLIADLKTAYQQKATITSLGDSGDKGTGYRLGAPAKQVAQAVSDDLIALVGKQSAADVHKAIAQIPDKTFTLDLWVKNNELTDVSLDLTQFLDKPVPGKKMAIDVAVDVNGGKVSAPAGATEIDVKQLLSQIPPSALTGGGLAVPGAGISSSGSGRMPAMTKAQLQMLKRSGLTDAQIKTLIAAQKAAQKQGT